MRNVLQYDQILADLFQAIKQHKEATKPVLIYEAQQLIYQYYNEIINLGVNNDQN